MFVYLGNSLAIPMAACQLQLILMTTFQLLAILIPNFNHNTSVMIWANSYMIHMSWF
jgi:hypothetical protein